MSDPTEAEIKTQGQNAVKLFEHLRTAGGTASPNLIGLIDTIEQASEGDFLKDQEDGLGGIRNLRGRGRRLHRHLGTWGQPCPYPTDRFPHGRQHCRAGY